MRFHHLKTRLRLFLSFYLLHTCCHRWSRLIRKEQILPQPPWKDFHNPAKSRWWSEEAEWVLLCLQACKTLSWEALRDKREGKAAVCPLGGLVPKGSPIPVLGRAGCQPRLPTARSAACLHSLWVKKCAFFTQTSIREQGWPRWLFERRARGTTDRWELLSSLTEHTVEKNCKSHWKCKNTYNYAQT